MTKVQTKNPLGYQSVGKLLLRFALPAVVSMLVNAVYNIVDQIFIGQGVGYLGNAATTIAFP
ncbi:MAG: MATE family efflux transporter, partial [Lachnospiraceae bacterium]